MLLQIDPGFCYRIKSSLNQYFESTGRVAVYFERNILSAHFQLQVVPVPIRLANHLEDIFKVTKNNIHYSYNYYL